MGIALGTHSNIGHSAIIQNVNRMLVFGSQQIMSKEEEEYLEAMDGLIFEFRMSTGTNRKFYRKVIGSEKKKL